jgi:hypothetical protein
MGAGGTQKRELHFVLRYSNTLHGFDTIKEHVSILERRRRVWMGKFGLGISRHILEVAQQQIAEGIPTWVYLSGQGKTRFRGRLADIQGGGVKAELLSPDKRITPRYYSSKPCSVWFQLDAIEECVPKDLQILRLYNTPGFAPSFTSMRGLMYVTMSDGEAAISQPKKIPARIANGPGHAAAGIDSDFDELDW